jgi:hypothetical protein
MPAKYMKMWNDRCSSDDTVTGNNEELVPMLRLPGNACRLLQSCRRNISQRKVTGKWRKYVTRDFVKFEDVMAEDILVVILWVVCSLV